MKRLQVSLEYNSAQDFLTHLPFTVPICDANSKMAAVPDHTNTPPTPPPQMPSWVCNSLPSQWP